MSDLRPAPNATDFEWSGTIVGVSNAVTRVRGPVAVDRNIDSQMCEHFLQLARRALEGYQCHIHDAVIHGVGVRLFTDSHHVADFWSHHWFTPQEWREATGEVPPAKPRLTVYAIGNLPGREPIAYACPSRDTVLVLGSTWYGTVRDETLAALSRILADEQGAYLLRASATSSAGQATLSTGTGRTTHAFSAMESLAARYISDDATVVRFAYRRRAGGWVLPTAAGPASGWRALDWLDSAKDPDAHVRGVTEEGYPIELDVEDLDLKDTKALAYAGERRAYVRTSLVRRFPGQAWTFVRSTIENAPEPSTPDGDAEDITRATMGTGDVAGRSFFASLPPPKAQEIVARFIDSDGTRAMIDPIQVFGRSRVVRSPWASTPVTTVVRLRDGAFPAEGEALGALSRRLIARATIIDGSAAEMVRTR